VARSPGLAGAVDREQGAELADVAGQPDQGRTSASSFEGAAEGRASLVVVRACLGGADRHQRGGSGRGRLELGCRGVLAAVHPDPTRRPWLLGSLLYGAVTVCCLVERCEPWIAQIPSPTGVLYDDKSCPGQADRAKRDVRARGPGPYGARCTSAGYRPVAGRHTSATSATPSRVVTETPVSTTSSASVWRSGALTWSPS
jgi:hypothetical protein